MTLLLAGGALLLLLAGRRGDASSVTTPPPAPSPLPGEPSSDRAAAIAQGEARGVAEQQAGSLPAELDYDRPAHDRTMAIGSDPQGGLRTQPVILGDALGAGLSVQDTAAALLYPAVVQMWSALGNSGAGISYVDGRGQFKFMVMQRGTGDAAQFYVVQWMRSAQVPQRVRWYWRRPENVPDASVARLPRRGESFDMGNGWGLYVPEAQGIVASPDGSDAGPQSLWAATVPGNLALAVVPSQHVCANPNGARLHPVTGQPWECYSTAFTLADSINGAWSLVAWSPFFPQHRSGDASLYEPHLGGGTRMSDGFAHWVAVLNMTGDPPRGQWVGEGLGAPQDCLSVDGVMRCDVGRTPDGSSPCAQRDAAGLWQISDTLCPAVRVAAASAPVQANVTGSGPATPGTPSGARMPLEFHR